MRERYRDRRRRSNTSCPVSRKPTGGGLTSVKATFQSIHGQIVSDWKIENGQFRLNVVIPVNTTAEVFVPAASADAVKENGKPAAQRKR